MSSENAPPHATSQPSPATTTQPPSSAASPVPVVVAATTTTIQPPWAELGPGGWSGSMPTAATAAIPRPSPHIPVILPHERVFPIQIGSELFKMSGASLSSDAPSYFSQYFQCQLKTAEATGSDDAAAAVRTLYIDRDPTTFRDIALHLQGYHVAPRDGTHFVRLFADAQFYSLPKLISQLYEEPIFISIGHREFQIPRDLFADPGNSPNFFSLGFAVFFSSPHDLFPGLDRRGLIRPPSILPPSVPGRSADTFAELLHLLRGYPVDIRSETHRAALLRDCRYFHFKGLEQRLVAHTRSYNQARQRNEITLRLEDVLKSGISVVVHPPDLPAPTAAQPIYPYAAWVNYARPFVDDESAELVLEIGGEDTKLHFFRPPAAASPSDWWSSSSLANPPIRVEFFRDAKVRFTRLLEVIATKLNLPPTTQPLGKIMAASAVAAAASKSPAPGNTPLSEDLVCVVFEPETAISLDGRPFPLPVAVADAIAADAGDADDGRPSKRRRINYTALAVSPAVSTAGWIVRTGQWRLRIQRLTHGKSALECVLVGVRIDAVTSELTRNHLHGFLGGT